MPFFLSTFTKTGRRAVSSEEAEASLADAIERVSEFLPDEHPRKDGAASYLADWVEDEWLRRRYDDGSYFFHLSPDVEKALRWVEESLEERAFVGTESKLSMMHSVLGEILSGTETDPEAKLGELLKKRAEIDAEIDAVKSGRVFASMDDFRVRDRMQQFERMSKELLVDFSGVEEKFRELAREIRREIAETLVAEGSKGTVMEKFLDGSEKIASSEQGRSFEAFVGFLHEIGDEFTERLEKVLSLPAVADMNIDPRMNGIRVKWHSSVVEVRKTVSSIVDGLSRFVSSVGGPGNKRFGELMDRVEGKFLSLARTGSNGVPDAPDFAYVDSASGMFSPFGARPLRFPSGRGSVSRTKIEEEDVSSMGIRKLLEVDTADRKKIASAMKKRLLSGPFSVGEYFAEKGPKHGLEEVLYCLATARDMGASESEDEKETVKWNNEKGVATVFEIPKIIVPEKKSAVERIRKTEVRA